MARNPLVRTMLFPEKLYNDFLIYRNNRRIKKGSVSWPRECLHEVLWIHPDEIIGSLHRKDRFPAKMRGRLVPGDWDQAGFKQIEESTAYKVLDLRYRKGIEWEDLLHEYALPHGFLNEKQIRKYRDKASMRDETYRDLRENGWRVSTKKKKSLLFSDELTVNMTRDGRYLRNHSGMHRLVMARFLGLSKIPCLLNVVHPDFFLANGNHGTSESAGSAASGMEILITDKCNSEETV
jgi:hypothetical protein